MYFYVHLTVSMPFSKSNKCDVMKSLALVQSKVICFHSVRLKAFLFYLFIITSTFQG